MKRSRRLPHQDEDQSGSRLQPFPGYFYLESGMSPEPSRSELGVDSEEVGLTVIRRPKCDFQSYCIHETTCLSLCPHFCLTLEQFSHSGFQENLWFLPEISEADLHCYPSLRPLTSFHGLLQLQKKINHWQCLKSQIMINNLRQK